MKNSWIASRARLTALALLFSLSITSALRSSVTHDARGWDPSDPCVSVTVSSSWESGSGVSCPWGSTESHSSGTEEFTGDLCPGDYAEFNDESYSTYYGGSEGCEEWSYFNQTYS